MTYIVIHSSSTGSSEGRKIDEFIATDLQTEFTLTFSPVDGNSLEVNVNGAKANSNDFSIIDTTLTWLDTDFTLEAGDVVIVSYFYTL